MKNYQKIFTPFHRDEVSKKLNIEKYSEYSPLNKIYELINLWEFTEKLDGANISIKYKDGLIDIKGRTEASEPPKEIINFINEKINLPYLESIEKEIIIYGEGYGGKIQRGKSGCLKEKFIGFDVNINDIWLSSKNAKEIINNAGFDFVFSYGLMTLKEASKFVQEGFFANMSDVPVQAEGLIGRTIEPLFLSNGERLILKLKTKDFPK